jgi:RimJ/RimL family protein N-acetyltransferase
VRSVPGALTSLPRLVTPRLTLVPQSLAAVRALVDGGDPGLPLGAGYPHADSLDVLRLAALGGAAGGPGGWFVVLAGTGEVIGDCGPKGPADPEGGLEIGYGLASPYRGQGYGGEAVGAMVEWLRTVPGVREVTAEVAVGNTASRRLLERLGFAVERTEDGSWWLHLPA